MKQHSLLAACLMLFVFNAPATVLYVDLNSTNPTPPYAIWSTAATNIQDAIDASSDGDQILVTNGIYQTGGRVVNGSLTNRVVINKAITVQSVNGPTATVIQGYQVPGTIYGDSAVRCVYLTNNAALIGFTLTNGATRSVNGTDGGGGGVFCQSASGIILSNCVIIANMAYYGGGGIYQGTLVNCTVVNNSILTGYYGYGGGAYQSYLINCTVIGNSCNNQWGNYGGGMYNANATNCVIAGNSCNGGNTYGGGAYMGNLVNCTITGNFASFVGGGTCYANQINCINYFNNCPNVATPSTNYIYGSFSYCCTTPLPGGTGNIANDPQLASVSHLSINSPCRGAGNAAAASGVDIDGEFWANPPSIGCDELYPGNVIGSISINITASDTNRAVGYAANFQANISGPVYASKWDFGDGTVVSNEPYMSHSWSAVGDYPVVLTAYNNSYPTGLTATLVVHVYQPTIFYVVASNPAPVAPYDSWTKAATNIQNAVDVAGSGSLILVSNGVYSLGSRISSDGGTNRVVVAKPLTLQSVNGSAVTLINGGNTLRCVYLTNGAVLNGFTLTNGNTFSFNGGGVFCASTNVLVSNCLLVKNMTSNYGGGAFSGIFSNCTFVNNQGSGSAAYTSVLETCTVSMNSNNFAIAYCNSSNCLITGNSGNGVAIQSALFNCMVISNTGSGIQQSSATGCKIIGNSYTYESGVALNSFLTNCLLIGNTCFFYAGSAAQHSTLVNCTIVNNLGGGATACSLENCIVYSNYSNGTNFNLNNTANNSCIIPLPPSGTGNFTNAPLFVNINSDFHLQSNSPCINAGKNSYVTTITDFDGNPRIVGGTVDIGAYEYQTPSSILSYAWAQQYGLPTDGSADYLDSDGDGMNNWQEWKAGTNPTNAASVLKLSSPSNSVSGVTVTWQSVTNVTYYLQSSTNLSAQPAFISIHSNLVGQAGSTSYTDTTATNGGSYFYRVGVQ